MTNSLSSLLSRLNWGPKRWHRVSPFVPPRPGSSFYGKFIIYSLLYITRRPRPFLLYPVEEHIPVPPPPPPPVPILPALIWSLSNVPHPFVYPPPTQAENLAWGLRRFWARDDQEPFMYCSPTASQVTWRFTKPTLVFDFFCLGKLCVTPGAFRF